MSQASNSGILPIFRVLFLYEDKHVERFSNLIWCTFKNRCNDQELTEIILLVD